MNSQPFPTRFLKELRSSGALSTLVLPGQKSIFGTVQVDQGDHEEPRFGDFVATSSDAGVNRRQQASLLLPSMNLFFSVNVIPGMDSPQKVHFECVGWRYMQGAN